MQTGIVLTINASAHNDVVLKVGPGTETVEVLASTSLVNYDNATVQGGIEPQTLSALPIAIANGNQRSSAQLAVLLPGVRPRVAAMHTMPALTVASKVATKLSSMAPRCRKVT